VHLILLVYFIPWCVQAADFSLSEGVAPFSLTATGTHSHSLTVQCIPSELGQRQAYLTISH
jgi:hypothetical protein